MNPPAKTVSSTRVEMAQIMEPNDANFLGKVFGGSIMAMIDLCAYATASKFAGTICVTASLDRVDFHDPINVGELVSMFGRVSFVGRTSVEVTIDIWAENVFTGEKRQTTTARTTMVALKDGKPTEVPRLVCETREDKVAFLEGRMRRDLRGRQRAELDAILDRLKSADDAELDRMMAEPNVKP